MQERIILFDLDGTLTDSGPGIMKASQFALRAYGVERDWQELDFFVGPPLDETFGQFMPKEDIPGAIDQFRVYYHDVGWLENEPYPGVREMLDLSLIHIFPRRSGHVFIGNIFLNIDCFQLVRIDHIR